MGLMNNRIAVVTCCEMSSCYALEAVSSTRASHTANSEPNGTLRAGFAICFATELFKQVVAAICTEMASEKRAACPVHWKAENKLYTISLTFGTKHNGTPCL